MAYLNWHYYYCRNQSAFGQFKRGRYNDRNK